MVDINFLKHTTRIWWDRAKRTRDFNPVAVRLLTLKPRYQEIEKQTGVPWFVVAVIHNRESGARFDRNLANGQPLNMVTTLVPRGRGPFKTFEDSAVDALLNCHPFLGKHDDWSLTGTLTAIERYNGLGYARLGVPSPYIWAGTSVYKAGKYVGDGKYDPTHVDKQLGCAGLIMALHDIDPTVIFSDGYPVAVKKKTLRDRVQSFLNWTQRFEKK